MAYRKIVLAVDCENDKEQAIKKEAYEKESVRESSIKEYEDLDDVLEVFHNWDE